MGVGQDRYVEKGGEALLVEPVRRDARLECAPRGLDDLSTTAVVECDPELQPVLVRGRGLELPHLALEGERRAVAAADESCADAFAREVLQLAVDRLAERLHQRVDLLWRTLPILGRER